MGLHAVLEEEDEVDFVAFFDGFDYGVFFYVEIVGVGEGVFCAAAV